MAYRRGAPLVSFGPHFVPFVAMFHLVLAAVRVCDWVVYRVRFRGRENLRGAAPAVLVSNHTLLFDPGIISHAISPRRTYFTMLEETALIPYLGTFVRLLGAIPIPQGAGSLRVLDEAARMAFHTLGFLHFFPEGELSLQNQQLQEFHPGAFLLACRHGLPIIPVTTVLHRRQWRGRSVLRVAGRALRIPPRVTVVVGRPILPAEADRRSPVRAARKLAQAVREEMQSTIDAYGGSKEIGRGLMPRLVRHAEAKSA